MLTYTIHLADRDAERPKLSDEAAAEMVGWSSDLRSTCPRPASRLSLSSFIRADGHVLPITGFALGENDRFFEGEGFFNALLGCNLWTARMLQSAGLRTGLWTPLPVLLTTSLDLFNELPK